MSTNKESSTTIDAALRLSIRQSTDRLLWSGVRADEPHSMLSSLNVDILNPNSNRTDNLVDDSTQVVTRADIDTLILAIGQRYQHLPEEKLSEIKATLLKNVGVSKANFSEIVNQVINEARVASEKISASLQQTPQEHMKQLLFAINEADKKISGLLGSMEDDGVTFDVRDKKRIQELQAWVDAHPDDKKSAQYQEYISLQRKMAQDAEAQANDPIPLLRIVLKCLVP